MKFYPGRPNFLLIALAFCSSAFAQAPINRLFGTYGTETGKAGFVHSDSTIYAVGTSSAFTDLSSQVYLVKIDASGNLLWSRFYGDAGVDDATDICLHADTCIYMVANTYQGPEKGYDIRIIKTDLDGMVIWNKTYGGAGWDVPARITPISDTSFAVCGYTYTGTAGLADGMVFAFNTAGDSLWLKSTGTVTDDFFYDIDLKNPDTLVAVGERITSEGKKQGWLMEMDITGGGVQSYYYGDTFNYSFNALDVLPNGDYGLGLTTDTINGVQNNVYIWRIDHGDHSIVSDLSTTGPGDEYCTDLVYAQGNYYLLGNTNSFGLGGYDMLLFQFDTAGWFVSGLTFGTILDNYGNSIFMNNNGSCTMVGSSPGSYGPNDVWIVNLDAGYSVYNVPDSGFDPNNVAETNAEHNHFVLYPNPAIDGFNLQASQPVETVLIHDRSGRMILNVNRPGKYISLDGVAAGLYLVQVSFMDGTSAFSKLVVK